MNADLNTIIQELISDYGIPRSVRNSLENSMGMINSVQTDEERISYIVSLLDEASSDHNVSPMARIHIWNIVSTLESMLTKK